jgi:dipeptidase D
MKETLLQLEPLTLWKYFYELTRIPRPSKQETAVVRYVKSTGESLGLHTHVDDIGNVIIKKPAKPGYESKKGVILQAHVDMVPQKNTDTDHDFEKDPISLLKEDEWITADKTTLGADNGIGVASMLAILESDDIEHGPVEALFTVDEETGMSGAFALEPGLLEGDILLNLDSEDEGELFVGCAGGMDAAARMIYTPTVIPDGHVTYNISLTGLKGGHSGLDIHLGRGNANKLLARLIKPVLNECSGLISRFNGGTLRNAIPREAFATLAIPGSMKNKAKEIFQKEVEKIKTELEHKEPSLHVAYDENAFEGQKSADASFSKKFIHFIYSCPNGVIRMSDTMPGVVETSNNLAIATLNEGVAELSCLLRSSLDSAKDDLASTLDSIFALGGETVKFSGSYPGWQPNPESAIREVMVETYKNKYNQEPAIKAIHAGLECGILGATYPAWDMISFGPTIRFPHSPDEKVHIPSVEKFWDFLVETLKNIPEKK